jgi:acetolactate synthase small subunit
METSDEDTSRITLVTSLRKFVEVIEKQQSRYIRFEVLTAVTVENVVFWDIKTQFVPHSTNITSLLQSSDG